MDLVLAISTAAATFSHADDLRRPWSEGKNVRGYKVIMQHHIRRADDGCSPKREQINCSGPCSDDVYHPWHSSSLCGLSCLERQPLLPLFHGVQEPGNEFVCSADQVQAFLLVLLHSFSQPDLKLVASRTVHAFLLFLFASRAGLAARARAGAAVPCGALRTGADSVMQLACAPASHSRIRIQGRILVPVFCALFEPEPGCCLR